MKIGLPPVKSEMNATIPITGPKIRSIRVAKTTSRILFSLSYALVVCIGSFVTSMNMSITKVVLTNL